MGRLGTLFLVPALASAVLGADSKSPPDPLAEYASRAAKLEREKGAMGWLKLADFCEEHVLLDQRTECLHKAVAAEPDNAAAHRLLDEAKYLGQWMPMDEADAKEIEAKQDKGLVFYGLKWMETQEAGKLREKDREATGWPVEVRVDTPHTVIYSGWPLASTLRMAAMIENEVATYRRFYGETWKLAPVLKPLKVYLCPDRATYVQVSGKAVGSPPTGAGNYFFGTKILYVDRCSNASVPLDKQNERVPSGVVAHEALHALDDQLASVGAQLPLWLKEGRAHHFYFGVSGRQVIPGAVRIPRTESVSTPLLETLESLPVAGMMAENDQAKFDQKHYFLAWGWVHFLFHGDGGRHAAAFRTYLAGKAKWSMADFEKTVGKIGSLEPAFKDYVKDTLVPLAKASERP